MVGVVIGGLLAVVAGLVVNAVWQWRTTNVSRRQLLADVLVEAKQNVETLRANGLSTPPKAFVELYTTSVWEGAIATGASRTLNDRGIAHAMGHAYSRVEVARKWDTLYVQSVIRNGKDQRLLGELTHTVLTVRRSALRALEQMVVAVEGEEGE